MLACLVVKRICVRKYFNGLVFSCEKISQVVKIPGFTLEAIKENYKRALFFLFCFVF